MNSKQNHSVRTASVQVNILIVSAAIWVIALAASFNGAPSKPAASNVNDTVSPRAVCDPELSLADRVAYQYAIEEVYWRHRIWPNENGRPKPLLDEMTSHAQMQEKVERALRHSNLLAEEGRAITRDQLQAEMERMARQTKQPEMLNELFSVLNNDPGLIAECLVRPILSDRLIRDLDSHDQKSTAQVNDRTKSNLQARLSAEGKRDYLPPDVVFSSASCPGDTWTPTSTVGAPSARARHTVVWTGSEMIVWGGESSFAAVNTGGRYNPSTDSWSATATTNAPSVREYHTAVWTGGEMIVWAGEDFTDNTGGRYNPITDSWVATSTSNAPSARDYHTAVWTGNEMIVWGGFGGGTAPLLNSGGRYNPSTDSWTATSTIGAPAARFDHTAVWTGSEMIVWGGAGGLAVSNSGGRYNPNTNSWVPTTTTNAPGGRQWHTALWTGSEMIVWGGYFNTILSDGGRYNPSTNSWIATAMANAPIIILHTAVWTGGEMIVWGGEDANNFNVNIGGRYSPFTDSWVATSTTSAPIGREMHSAIWTGSEMIVWGGETYAQEFQYNDTGGSYCAQGPFPTPPPTPTPGGSPTPTSTPSPTPSVSPTPSPTPSPTATPAPSPTPFFCTILYQNFDYATTPNLPPGWTTSYTPGAADCTPNGTCPFGGNWVTTKDNPYSGPISAFHDAPACVTDSVMNTPTFSLPSSCPLFASFVHSFNLESGHDGAVLEISINGGPFVDIVSAGGSVNYNGTISTGSLSPIAGRPAWTGNSGGYVGAGITFPSAARGQQVALRFRLATDCAGGGEGMGWYIDVIYIWWNCESCFISPTPSPTPAATPSPTLAPTATPAVAGVSGSILSCSNSSPGPVPSVTLSLTGSASGSTLSDANGNYMFSSLIVGGSYTVTPSKAALSPGAAGINTVDVLAVQRHYLGVALLGGCRLTSADVNGDASVTTIDVIAIQRFYLGLSTGVANVGKYQFNPASRSYPNLVGNQTNQNYDTLIFGDAAPPFVAP